jgi:hypothetical protein
LKLRFAADAPVREIAFGRKGTAKVKLKGTVYQFHHRLSVMGIFQNNRALMESE